MSTLRQTADEVVEEAFGVSPKVRSLPLSGKPGWWVVYGVGKVRLTRRDPRDILTRTVGQGGKAEEGPDPT